MTQAAYDPGVPGSLPPSPPIDAATAAETAGAIFQGPGNYTLSIQGVPRGGAITVYVWLDGIFSAGTGARGPAGIAPLPDGRVRVLGWVSVLQLTRGAGPDPVFDQALPVVFAIPEAATGLPLPGLPAGGNPKLREPWPGKTSEPCRPKSEIAN